MLGKTSTALLLVFGLFTTSAASQGSAPLKPYDVAEAYEIYSLLLPKEQSYDYAPETVMIRKEAYPVNGQPCLTDLATKKFADAVAGFKRLQKEKWLLQPKFKLKKPYKLIGPEIIAGLPNQPQSAAAYVEMSTVGFDRIKTRAIVFMGSSCGGLCGSWTFHLLEKTRGEWKEVDGVTCMLAS